MSYCRFENTLAGLGDCYDSMEEDKELSSSEEACRMHPVRLCRDIVSNYDHLGDRE